MTRWARNGHLRGRRGIRSATKSIVERLFGDAPRPGRRPSVEQFESRIPASGPISFGSAGLWLDQPWGDLLQDDAAPSLSAGPGARPSHSASVVHPLPTPPSVIVHPPPHRHRSSAVPSLPPTAQPTARSADTDPLPALPSTPPDETAFSVAPPRASSIHSAPTPQLADAPPAAPDDPTPQPTVQLPLQSPTQPPLITSPQPPSPVKPTDPAAPAQTANTAPPANTAALTTTDVPLKSSSLADWTLTNTGGSPADAGAVTFEDGDLVLREGDSFLVAAEQSFVVPANPGHLAFEFDQLSFDTTDPDSINDAFEAALLDSAGQTLVHTFTSARDAFFNITEGEPPALGTGTTLDDQEIRLDLADLAPGSTATVVIRLVNNDSDTNTSVRIVSSHNEPPAVTVQPIVGLEGQVASLSASFTDPGDTAAHTAVIDWGDNTTTTGTVGGTPSAGTVSGTHTYADNGVYPIKVTVVDSQGATGEGTSTADIANVAPDLSAGFRFTSLATPTANRLVTEISGDFTDPGFTSPAASTAETFTTTIDWGDGQTQTVAHSVTPGSAAAPTTGRFTAAHEYASAGLYEVTVRAVDDDGGSDVVTLRYGIMRIDVVPTINIPEKGVIPVKILPEPGFLPGRDLDPATLRFGPGSSSESHAAIHGDGMTHFPAPESAIRPSDTVAFLFARHWDGTFFAGLDTIRLTPASNPGDVGGIPNLPPAKFFVADPGADRVYRYDPAGASAASYPADTPARNILGVAANAAGDTVWTIDGTTHLVSVQKPNGSFLGAWQATGLRSPAGITTDGNDVWVVDAAARRVIRFNGAAAQRSGYAAGAAGFALHTDNTSPSDLVTDGTRLFVTDDATDEVFVYDRSGRDEGRWELDARNADASGLTLDPTGASDDLWVLDRADRQVYTYDGGTGLLNGTATAAATFDLAAANTSPEAIADPPVQSAAGDSLLPADNKLVYTTSADFDAGTSFNVNSVDTPDALQLDRELESFPFIWISNSGEGTISKFDTATGKELARYRTGPNALATRLSPSRTAVTGTGDVWVANRAHIVAGDQASIVKVLNGGFVDRNNNGAVDTSADLNNDGTISAAEMLPWDANLDGQPDDERIAMSIPVGRDRVNTSTLRVTGVARSIVLDKNDDVWVGLYAFDQYEVYDGTTGVLETIVPTPVADITTTDARGPYGAVVDRNGILYGATLRNTLSIVDTNTRTFVRSVDMGISTFGTYGITLDADGAVWVTGFQDRQLMRYDPVTNVINRYFTPNGETDLRGVGVDDDRNVWVASTAQDRLVKFTFAADHRTLLSRTVVNVGNGPTSAVVDADGFVWTTTRFDDRAYKVNPNTNAVVGFFPTGDDPYNYSDMTGRLRVTVTQPQGHWTEVVDGETAQQVWASVAVGADAPANTSVRIRVRASDDRTLLAGLPWQEVASASLLASVRGRFLNVEVTLRAAVEGITPLVRDVTVTAAARPTIVTHAPPTGSNVPADERLLISGLAGAGNAPNKIVSVTANGTPVDVLDDAGHFFTNVTPAAGANHYTFVATDVFGQTATTTLSLEGVRPVPGAVDFTAVTDVPSFEGVYARTSWDELKNLLHADLAIRNTSQFPIGKPLLVGVTRLSDPSVAVRGAAGVTPDGIPYYDFSGLVTGAELSPDAQTAFRAVTFHNPAGGRFTYDLVLLGKVNRAPAFTSTPTVAAIAGKPYGYDAAAADPDGDDVSFELLSGPDGMTVDADTGTLDWSPTLADVGNHGVRVLALDGKGGSGEQAFTVTATAPGANRPPVFVTPPVVSATVGLPYDYDSDAVDPDQDDLTYSLVDGPSGMTVDPVTGVVSWTPPEVVAAPGRTIDFENVPGVTVMPLSGAGSPVPASARLTNQLQASHGVSFTSTPGYVGLTRLGAGHATSGANGIGGVSAANTLDYRTVQVTFSMPGDPTRPASTTFASIRTDRIGLGSGTVTLEAFDVNGVLLDSDTILDDTGGKTISVSAPNIHSLRVNGSSGTAALDDLTFATLTAVPLVPVTIAATDEHGASAHQSFTIRVDPQPGNNPPTFVSTPPTQVSLNTALPPEPVDLSKWTKVQYNVSPGGQPDANWVIDAAANTVNQVVNSDPSILLGNFDFSDAKIEGIWRMNPEADDDFVGFVFGYQDPQHFYLFDWKGASQTQADVGMTLKVVNSDTPVDNMLWATAGSPGRVTNIFHNSVPWAFNTDYRFALEFHPGTFSISVHRGTTQVAAFTLNDGTYTNGKFGFYNYSQGQVRYSGFRTTEVPLPTYAYDADAVDPDDDLLAYTLVSGPQGMQVDPNTGQVNWPVGVNQAGVHPVTLRVSDGRGGADEQTFTINVAQTNLPPDITTTPRTSFGLDSTDGYVYDVDATDPNSDPVSFTLLEGPAGATINSTTGVLTWTPDAVGTYSFIVRASDGRGGADQQAFTLRVTETTVNSEPVFVTTPPASAAPGRRLFYAAAAADADGDLLTYGLSVGPAGMAVDPESGAVVWTPRADQVGQHDVILRADDGRGGAALQAFKVNVVSLNSAPAISSRPVLQTAAASLYHYPVQAQDAENDPIDFRLDAGPAGMTIDATTGVLTWTPTAAQVGSHAVTISVGDGKPGPRGEQRFTLAVLAQKSNTPPVIDSTPRDTVQIGATYLYQIEATDADADRLVYALDSGPTGMTIDTGTGLVTWAAAQEHIGQANAVRVSVSDGRGGSATQEFTVAVANSDDNAAPTILSQPGLAATTGRQYRYDAAGEDGDGDPIAWSLDEAPQGLSVHPQLGTVIWTPRDDQAGSHNVTLRLADPRGAFTTQVWTINVKSLNVPPVITSTPVVVASVGSAYSYAVRATDSDNDTLSFALSAPPAGMTINQTSGLISWTPTVAQIGQRPVTVQVSDGRGGSATQQFTINVAASATNRPAVITSTPIFVALVGGEYRYQMVANDPDGDIVAFHLRGGPTGMTVDSLTGLVLWNPTAAQAGTHAVSLLAVDPSGAGMVQNYNLRAANNNAPTITSAAVTGVTAGLTYQYGVKATDPDSDTLRYDLAKGPAGMTIDTLGRIRWATTGADVGAKEVEVVVTDPFGATARQAFTLNVAADNAAPKVTVQSNYNPAELGDVVTFLVQATDNVGVTGMTLTVGGVAYPLDAQGRADVTMNTAGPIDAVATATDAASLTGTATLAVFVIDTSDADAPTVAITSPADGATITSLADVIGTASDDNLVDYQLEISPADLDTFTLLARGTAPVTAATLGKLDPSLLANDSYRLRLTATDAGGNVASVESVVNVVGELKLGNFKLSFTDLIVPVAGIPITVSRTYDTLDAKRTDNFGYGWSLDFRDSDVRTTVPETGMEDELLLYNGFRNGDRVYITLPGGERESFTFHAQVRLSIFNAALYRPSFVPDPGVTSQLTVPEFVLSRGASGDWTSLGVPYNLASGQFGQYTLTTVDGAKFRIDPIGGDVIDVTDRRGNRVTFSDAGVFSSAGPSIRFDRDARGRITSVTDPAGDVIRYAYDSAGDLVSVTDRVGNLSRYAYRTDRPHYLEKVIDPLGRTGARAEYDDAGRVARVFDAAGNPIEFGYDAGTSTYSVTDGNGHTTTYVYDNQGNVTREVDAAGKVTLREYDANNNLSSMTDPLGRTTTYVNDAVGNVLTQTDHLGNVTRATYNALNQVLTTTDPEGNTSTNTFDAFGNALSVKDPNGAGFVLAYDTAPAPAVMADALGHQTRFAYDSAGRVLEQIDPTGARVAYTYDAVGNRLTETTRVTAADGTVRSLVTRYTYDDNGRVTSKTDPEGGVSRTVYDALGNVSAAIDPLGRRTEFTYDARNLLVETLFPDGTTTTAAYDGAGNRVRATDPAGRETHFVYDRVDRLVETIYPDATPAVLSDNPRRKTEYDAAGQVTADVDERRNRTEYGYDGAGRRTSVRDALGKLTTFEYDDAGRLIAETDPLGHTTRYTYAGTRTTATTFADGSTRRTEYDAKGRPTSATDANGRVTRFGYDALDRLVSVTDALERVTTYGYDELGNLVRQTDANSHTTRYEYDGMGRPTATVLQIGQRSETEYDRAGNLTEATDFNGVNLTFEYDVMNRLVGRHYSDGSGVTFTYTDTGMRETETDARGTTTYAYDERDRLTRRTEPDGRAIRHAYDVAGNRTATATPAQTINYTFDPLNRLKSLSEVSVGTATYTYDDGGNLTRTDLPNGTAEVRTYDSRNRPTLLTNLAAGGRVLSSYAYTLDAAGNRLSVVEDTGRRVDYTYDATYRLTEERITDPANGNRTYGYTYDPVGNRLTRNSSADGTTSYVYDGNDRLVSETTAGVVTTYAYDGNGNTLSKATRGTDRTDYEYDFDDRLTKASVVTVDGTKVVEYAYNADGLRVARIEAGGETRHLVDTTHPYAEVVEEYTPTGLVLARYVHGLDLVAQHRAGVVAVYLKDALGSTRALTSAAGAVTDRYVYDVFGREILRVGTTVNPYGFAGEARDAVTGLDYLRARHYAPATGRFMSRDTYAGRQHAPITLHRYLYADANPANKTDPSGLFGFGLADLTVANVISRLEAAVTAFKNYKVVKTVLNIVQQLDDLIFAGFVAYEVMGLVSHDGMHNLFSKGVYEAEWKKPTKTPTFSKFGVRYSVDTAGDRWFGFAVDTIADHGTKKTEQKHTFQLNLDTFQITIAGGFNFKLVEADALKLEITVRGGVTSGILNGGKGLPTGKIGLQLTMPGHTLVANLGLTIKREWNLGGEIGAD